MALEDHKEKLAIDTSNFGQLICKDHTPFKTLKMQETQKEKSTFTNVVDKADPPRATSTERQLQQILAKYVRAADSQDGETMGNLFSPDGNVEVYYSNGGKDELLFVLVGRKAIAHAFTSLMRRHPYRGWSHHTTFEIGRS